MSKGSEKHKQRNEAIIYFGKDLVRRSGSHCELCDAHGTKLTIHEVPPVPKVPDFDHCIFVCEACSEQINSPKKIDTNHWRCLNTSAWSQIPAVQVMSVLMLNHLSSHDWAVELKEQLYLAPEIQEWLESI